MFNEFEKEDDQWRPDEPKALKVIKKGIGIAIAGFVFLFIGFLLIRMFASQPPKSMTKVVWDEALVAEYNKQGKELEILRIPTSDAFSENSMFTIYDIAYIPSIKQLQFTIRYNDRVLDDYEGANELIDARQEAFVFSLQITRTDGAQTIHEYRYIGTERFGYTNRRLIFDNVDFENVSSIFVGVAFAGKPQQVDQQIKVYDNSKYKLISELPNFYYTKPKGVNPDIKSGKSA